MKTRMQARGSASQLASAVLALAAIALPSAAHASFLPPELMDTAAFYIAWSVIIVIPIAAIVVFWLVHILPEKIAHKRHHPQKDAIQTLCLLSLAFGGLLWPLAWLWAYTKPVSYRLAYGTDKGDEYFIEKAEEAAAGKLPARDMRHLIEEIDAIAARGAVSLDVQHARAKIETAIAATPAAPAPAVANTPAAQGAA